MSDNRCGSCAHWKNPWDGHNLQKLAVVTYDDDDLHTTIIEHDEAPRWGTCQLITLAWYGERVTVTAFTKDASDYAADLHTREDFGCTLWTEKHGPSR